MLSLPSLSLRFLQHSSDYSLNAGRYVGVVMEEDGKTEDEFLEDMQTMNEQLLNLNKQADKLGETIQKNLSAILGES